MIPLPPPRQGTMKKSSLAGGQNGESNLASPKCAFHVLTTQYHNASIRPVCDKQHQLTYIPAGVTAHIKHIGGVFVALVPYCPIITIGMLVMAIVIFNVLQSCGDRKGYILV